MKYFEHTIITAVLSAFLSGAVTSARAEYSANDIIIKYHSTKTIKERNLLLDLVGAMVSGITWVDVGLKVEQSIYMPNNLAISDDQAYQILERQITKWPDLGTKPYGLVLLFGLRQTFPCPWTMKWKAD